MIDISKSRNIADQLAIVSSAAVSKLGSQTLHQALDVIHYQSVVISNFRDEIKLIQRIYEDDSIENKELEVLTILEGYLPVEK